MIRQGRIDVRPLLTHELPFSEVQRAFGLSWDRKDGAIKVVLHYGR
jgi:threonine dehydrogenase-like Zn-dependent dehydrogenase